MKRQLEPELMDDDEQARAYAAADFAEPNSAFVDHVYRCVSPFPEWAKVVDLGCGPADIAIRCARRFPGWQIDAVDASAAMLRLAELAVNRASLQSRVTLLHERVPSDRLASRGYDIVMSNSLLHHLPDPNVLWSTVARVGQKSAFVVVADLARPLDPATARAIVETYSGEEPEVLRRDFFNSLCAAFTVDEVRGQLDQSGLRSLSVRMVSDRHWLVSGRLAGRCFVPESPSPT